MPTQVESMTVGLDTILFHLGRAHELLGEVLSEQKGMPETHILENLTIFQAETESTKVRLEGLIREMRGEKAA